MENLSTEYIAQQVSDCFYGAAPRRNIQIYFVTDAGRRAFSEALRREMMKYGLIKRKRKVSLFRKKWLHPL